MIFGRKNLDGDVRCLAHHIVHILPVVQGDQLESGEHAPEKVVKAGEPGGGEIVKIVKIESHRFNFHVMI